MTLNVASPPTPPPHGQPVCPRTPRPPLHQFQSLLDPFPVSVSTTQPDFRLAVVPEKSRPRREHGWSVERDPQALVITEHGYLAVVGGGLEKLLYSRPERVCLGVGKV